MLKSTLFTGFLLLGLAVSGCLKDPASMQAGEQEIRKLTPAEQKLVQSDNKFGLKLFRQVADAEKAKNVFISPLSVSMALGMTYNGAEGRTKTAMEETLELQGISLQEINESYRSLIALLRGLDPKVTFQLANSIWYHQEYAFEQTFIDLNQTYFDAQVRGADFKDPRTVDIINQWVDENTRGKIRQIIEDIGSREVMFLINAIYFKGIWSYEFNEEETRDDRFAGPDGSFIPCRMMIQSGDFAYFATPDMQAVDLPYGDGQFSMVIFLPAVNHSLDSFIGRLDPSAWDEWMDSFSRQNGTVEIPKFKLEYKILLNEVLKALGMAVAFQEGAADFTKMYPPGDLYISKVNHKTFLEVDEEGTEAAAVTSVGISVTSIGEENTGFHMRVDRPFVVAIRENHSRTILFIGKIVEPAAG